MNKRIAYFFIATAAFFWGIIGVFVSFLYEAGFNPTQVVALRVIIAAIILIIYIYMKNKHLFKIKLADCKYFVGTGIISIVFFNWCFFNAIQETSISVAAILLYTAPAFVTIFSRIFFKEPITAKKLTALLLTFFGCAFVVGILPKINGSFSTYGIILGLGSGLFYGLYSIFGKFALAKYDSLTVTVYTFIFAAIAIIPFIGLPTAESLSLLTNFKVLFSGISLGVFSTVLAFILYTKGLTAVETSNASIIATLEPVVAAVSSFLIFQEVLNGWQYLGIIMVITAVMIIQEWPKASMKNKHLQENAEQPLKD
ncbi:DMT family transporter [Calidifontibacillus erzurumensis]|uniref:DMT family transporter n=1 Tax=Calidifontibacillus erzurumensis TaxID=2741433 RepID=UPI0035B52141